jgi:hypothetical protein
MKLGSLKMWSRGFAAEDILGRRNRSELEGLLIASHFRTADHMTSKSEGGEVQSLGSLTTPPAGLPYSQFGCAICSRAILRANRISNKSHAESRRLVWYVFWVQLAEIYHMRMSGKYLSDCGNVLYMILWLHSIRTTKSIVCILLTCWPCSSYTTLHTRLVWTDTNHTAEWF